MKLAEIYEEHEKLLRLDRYATPQDGGRTSEYSSPEWQISVEAFIRRACESGSTLCDVEQRRHAQSLIDYWVANLLGSTRKADRSVGVLADHVLKQCEVGLTHQSKEKNGDPSKSVYESRRREIQLRMQARLYEESSNTGFLLGAAAIGAASEYSDDKTISDLVEASRRQRRKNFTNVLLAVAATAISFVALYNGAGPVASAYFASQVSRSTSEWKPFWLGLSAFSRAWFPREPWSTFASIRFEELGITRLNLNDANFIRSEFKKVTLNQCSFRGAHFTESVFDNSGFVLMNVAGREINDLSLAQFRNSRLYQTQFAFTDMFRANFDGSEFCSVTFSDVGLALTSFERAEFDHFSLVSISNEAWWLASGWSASQFSQLAATPICLDRLISSKAFERAEETLWDIPNSDDLGVFTRSNALGWLYATWGFNASLGAGTAERCTESGTEVGRSAVAEARRALGALERYKKSNPAFLKGSYRDYIEIADGTLGYALLQEATLQPAVLEEALVHLKSAVRSRSDPDTQFIYALASYVSGKTTGDAAMTDLALRQVEMAIKDPRFSAYHAIRNLGMYFVDGKDRELEQIIMSALDYRSPPKGTRCPSR